MKSAYELKLRFLIKVVVCSIGLYLISNIILVFLLDDRAGLQLEFHPIVFLNLVIFAPTRTMTSGTAIARIKGHGSSSVNKLSPNRMLLKFRRSDKFVNKPRSIESILYVLYSNHLQIHQIVK